MPYGTIKVDNITFDNGGTDKLLTVSGLFFSMSGALTVTGTISGGNVTAPTATFTSGSFTSLTGVTTTGTTANFVTHNGASGVFTALVSGATITGTTANFTSGNFIALSGTTTTVTSGVFSAGSATAPSVAVGTGTSNSPGIYSPGTDQLAISTGGSEVTRIDSSGRLLVGTSASRTNINLYGTPFQPKVQVEGAGATFTTGFSAIHYGIAYSPMITLGRSASSTQGTNALVADNGTLGAFNFVGNDGTNFQTAATIITSVDGTPGANSMPGRLVFSTTPSGSASSTERMRIDNAGTTTLTSAASTAPFIAKINTTEVVRIDSSGRLLVGTSTATGAAILQVQTPTTLSTTADNGIRFANTSTKVYPTTTSFNVTAGLSKSIELGTAQTIDTVTPGGFNYVGGTNIALTKSAGNTQDIERLYFSGFTQTFTWADANTCKQYVGFSDTFYYSGFNANSRTSSVFTATTITLSCPDTQTQTIANVYSSQFTLNQGGTSTVNITNWSAFSPYLLYFNISAGTKTSSITNAVFYDTNSSWGVQGTAGTVAATITNLFGLRLRSPIGTTGLTITNNWGLYQEWSSAKNWFAGASNQFPNITTTASGANAFLDSADSNRLYRSTSSLTYKRDVEDLDSNIADQILNLRPVWYRSKCAADCKDWSWYGLIAEEVAEIDPRFVHYGYQEDAYQFIETTETVELPPNDPRREGGLETEEVTRQERQLKADAQKVPNGVAYERLVVPLLDIIKRQKIQLESFEARLAALEAR